MDARQFITILPYLSEEQQVRVKDYYLAEMALACEQAEAVCREHNIRITPRPIADLFQIATGTNPHPEGRRHEAFERAHAFREGRQKSIFASLQRPGVMLEPLPITSVPSGQPILWNGIVHFRTSTFAESRCVTIMSEEPLPMPPSSMLARLPHWVAEVSWQLAGTEVGPLTEQEANTLLAYYCSESGAAAGTVSRVYREVAPTLRAGDIVVRYQLDASRPTKAGQLSNGI